MKHITPTTSLSKEQRKVVLERVLNKESTPGGRVPQEGLTPEVMSLDIASGRTPMSSSFPTLPSLPSNPSQGSIEEAPIPKMDIEAPPASLDFGLDKQVEEGKSKADIMTANPEELSPVEEQIQAALIADQLWKDSGGDDSLAAKMWNALKRASNTKHLDSPRDYFISCFVKWRRDPLKFSKAHSKESKLIKSLNDEFEASMQEANPEEEKSIWAERTLTPQANGQDSLL